MKIAMPPESRYTKQEKNSVMQCFEARGTVTEYADLATKEPCDTISSETVAEDGVIPDGNVYRNPEDNSLEPQSI